MGGRANVSDGTASFIGGGSENSLNGTYAVISGGSENSLNANYAAIGGGASNTVQANGGHAVITGGSENLIDAQFGAIGGGSGNEVTGDYSVIAGGSSNIVEGDYSCIPGGLRDTVSGNYTMVFGRSVRESRNYRVIFFDGEYSGKFRLNRDGADEPLATAHPLQVGTDGSNGNGAYLSSGGNWQSTSSRSVKDKFVALDGREVLARLAELPVESWNYRGTDERHIGPVSEDFVAAFDVGTSRPDGSRENMYLSHGDVAGVALLAVKELDRKTRALEEKAAAIEQLKAQMAELQALVQQLIEEQR